MEHSQEGTSMIHLLSSRSRLREESGFTLIELLVTVAIIGILAGLMQSIFALYRTRVFNTTAMTDLRNGFTALQGYLDDNDAYPTCATSACSSSMPGLTISDGVYLAFAQTAGESGTAIACHTGRGDRAYIRSSVVDLIVEVPISSCGP